jgi:hypothetical protein
MNLAIQITLIGYSILIGAIAFNAAANGAGLTTWYPFGLSIFREGVFSAFKSQSFLSLLFLFVGYPLLLGLVGYYISKLLST